MSDIAGQEKQHGEVTRVLAGICHNCPMRAAVDRNPDSFFGKVMRWHRGWCPAWAAYSKVYENQTKSHLSEG